MIDGFVAPTTLAHLPKAKQIDDSASEKFSALLKTHKINSEEYARLKKIVGRAPSFAELGVFSAMWSEHCSYKSSRVHLKRFPTKGKNVVVGPGENAGVVRIEGKLCAAFKMESHNHPSYIEPYQGAATGVGGILRDVFCMGARPVANLNCLRFGKRSHRKTSYLFQKVVKGIGDYGNCVGIPTVGGNISFDETYDGNCLVNAMTVGLIHEDRIFKGYASGIGNLVVYVGSSTGRDGIHGATMASDSFASKDEGERSAVQVGDPFVEKMLLEATLECLEKDLVVGLQDMGAAGLTSSSFEMASRAGSGLFIDLDRVPVRAQNMSAYELLLSESQERMLMVVKPEHWDELKEVFEKWQLAYNIIGSVTGSKRMQATYRGVLELDIEIAPLADSAPVYERPVGKWVAKPEAGFDGKVARKISEIGVEKAFLNLLRECGEKSEMFRQYDQHIGTRTVYASDEQGAGVLWLRQDLEKHSPYLGLVISTSCNERYCKADPRLGGSYAVLKAARMISAAGGLPLAATDCLNYGNPEDPKVMAEISLGVDGISEACEKLETPIVSGNVSLYNETDGNSISPTPMIGMVGKISDIRNANPAILKTDAYLALVSSNKAQKSFGASLAAKSLGFTPENKEIPAIQWNSEIEQMRLIQNLTTKPLAVRDIGEGGILGCVAKMSLSHSLGFKIELGTEAVSEYLGEFSGGYVLAFQTKDELSAFIKQASQTLLYSNIKDIGIVSSSLNKLSFGSWSVSREDAQKSYGAMFEFKGQA